MEQTEKTAIFERLLAIKVKMEPSNSPDPSYVTEKIWECHRYIDEVEAYQIKITQEVSVRQQALNNATSEYENRRDIMLSEMTDAERATMPNIKDREAYINLKLKDVLRTMKEHKNELTDLDNLLGAVNGKMKNLTGINADIRTQVRIMEAQIKLNMAPKGDPVAADLAMEMKRGVAGDALAGATTSVDESVAVDPTNLDVNNLLGDDDEEELPAPMDLSEKPDGIAGNNLSSDAVDPTLLDPSPQPDPGSRGVVPDDDETETGKLPEGTEAWPEEEPFEITTEETEPVTGTVDLDKILVEQPTPTAEQTAQQQTQGGATATITTPNTPASKNTEASPQGVDAKNEQKTKEVAGLDLDDLLDKITNKA